MNPSIKNAVLRFAMVTLGVVALVAGMALPAAAAPPNTAIHMVQGTVTAIGADGASFTVQSGNQTPVTIKVDANTRYLVVPLGRVNGYVNQQMGADKKGDKGKQTPQAMLRELHIPANWRNNLGWLETFESQGKFSDVQVGDRVIAQIAGDGFARQVMIVKAPVIQQVRGSITAISASSITIAASTGASVTLASNANTHVTVKGYIQPQTGQTAVAVYNRNTMIAQTISIQSNQSTVNPPPVNSNIVSIAVAPVAPGSIMVGASQQFTAMATYSNGTQADVTSQATWASAIGSVATVSATGVAIGLAAGSTLITAYLNGITSAAVTLTVIPATTVTATLTSVTVTPQSATILAGLTQQYNAVATYSNGTSLNVNSVATWASSNPAAATISASGLATGSAAGTTIITASLSGITSLGVMLTVTAPTLSSIAVTPPSATILVGSSQQYNAVAAYSNGTNLNVSSVATWASSNTTTATVSTTGLATGNAAGTTTITASLSGITSPGATLTVNTPTLSSITVTPGSPVTLHIGTTQQFAATAGYSNGTSGNVTSLVTWASSNVTAASVNAVGLMSGLAAGSTTLTAAMSGVNSAPVNVTVVP